MNQRTLSGTVPDGLNVTFANTYLPLPECLHAWNVAVMVHGTVVVVSIVEEVVVEVVVVVGTIEVVTTVVTVLVAGWTEVVVVVDVVVVVGWTEVVATVVAAIVVVSAVLMPTTVVVVTGTVVDVEVMSGLRGVMSVVRV